MDRAFIIVFGVGLLCGSAAFAQPVKTSCEVTRDLQKALSNGMTYAEVAAALGCDGVLVSKPASGERKIYQWSGKGPTGSYLRAVFDQDKMSGTGGWLPI